MCCYTFLSKYFCISMTTYPLKGTTFTSLRQGTVIFLRKYLSSSSPAMFENYEAQIRLTNRKKLFCYCRKESVTLAILHHLRNEFFLPYIVFRLISNETEIFLLKFFDFASAICIRLNFREEPKLTHRE